MQSAFVVTEVSGTVGLCTHTQVVILILSAAIIDSILIVCEIHTLVLELEQFSKQMTIMQTFMCLA